MTRSTPRARRFPSSPTLARRPGPVNPESVDSLAALVPARLDASPEDVLYVLLVISDGSHLDDLLASDDLAFLGSANRDEAVFERPDDLDLLREPSTHLAFGHGIHYCIGAALSRLEAPLALAAVLDRFPGIRLESSTPREWKPNITFRGLARLLVRA